LSPWRMRGVSAEWMIWENGVVFSGYRSKHFQDSCVIVKKKKV